MGYFPPPPRLHKLPAEEVQLSKSDHLTPILSINPVQALLCRMWQVRSIGLFSEMGQSDHLDGTVSEDKVNGNIYLFGIISLDFV